VVVGNGMAGCRTIEELLKLAPEHYDITVFGAEPHGNYNRIQLSPVLAGELRAADIVLNDYSWYAAHGITLHAGSRIARIDRKRRRVITTDNRSARGQSNCRSRASTSKGFSAIGICRIPKR
jgi:nitrite reductase (NADH) large subunit